MINLFIIDDDSICIYLCETMIKATIKEINITSFKNPVEALSSLTECSVDQNTVILLDINMPEMSGWEFFERFEAKKGNCRIFILTSSVDPRDKEKADNTLGIEGFITKPITKEVINLIFENVS